MQLRRHGDHLQRVRLRRATRCSGACLADADGDGICDPLEVAGCTNSLACNFDPAATDDDGSCDVAATHYDCDGQCLADSDGDGVCDPLEIAGCQDTTACDYNADATDEAECTYAEPFYNCDATCVNDLDGDGVCDELEITGCDDATACNFDVAVTDNDVLATTLGVLQLRGLHERPRWRWRV